MLDYENNKEVLPAAFSTALSQNIDALARFAALPYEDRQKLLFACSHNECLH